jgi:hypothetical protein
MITHDIDALTTIGTKLQAAFTALDEAETLFADHDLESSFFDGMLTAKLATVTDQALELVEFVGELTRKAIEIQAEDDITRIVDAALARVDAVQSGQAFGFMTGDGATLGERPVSVCDECPDKDACQAEDADGDAIGNR